VHAAIVGSARDPILTLTRLIAEPQSCRSRDSVERTFFVARPNAVHALPWGQHERRTYLASGVVQAR